MNNPFEDDERTYQVLVNDERQHSLWPVGIDVPAGWTVAHPEDTREACLAYVEREWTDMRPQSLVDAMNTEQ
ncbi:MbtH family protein [Streptomyces cacaoi]|uniref:MbtH family protein n=1 Tax=Streptomyces cacaoi TaxID=1898 RepID=UPI0011F0F5C7|nr:MbtH family protein [Streptomyces cacaoi]